MKQEEQTFTIKVTMNKRWVPYFLGMLKMMERLGKLGASRSVALYSDGDGDFRPHFEWDENLPPVAEPLKKEPIGLSPLSNGYVFDAG